MLYFYIHINIILQPTQVTSFHYMLKTNGSFIIVQNIQKDYNSTARSWDLQKLTDAQLVTKFPAFLEP